MNSLTHMLSFSCIDLFGQLVYGETIGDLRQVIEINLVLCGVHFVAFHFLPWCPLYCNLTVHLPSLLHFGLSLQDKTIVSGDSRGKLTFWNGQQGTQLKVGYTCCSRVISGSVSLNIYVSTSVHITHCCERTPALIVDTPMMSDEF